MFFVIVQTILSMLTDKDYCEDSVQYLNLLYNKVNNVFSTNKAEEAIFTINPGCMLIGLNKYGNNLADKPSICYEKSCLCLCSLTKDKDNPYNCAGKVCSVFSDLENINGDYSSSGLDEKFLLKASNRIPIGPGPQATTQYILNISKVDKGVYIKILESEAVPKNE